MQQAIRQAFSTSTKKIQVKGCWFHFCQALLRKINKMGDKLKYQNNADFRFWIKSFMALPLIPVEKLQDALDIIMESKLNRKQVNFLKYFVSQWCKKMDLDWTTCLLKC